jgi:hypothetical protein
MSGKTLIDEALELVDLKLATGGVKLQERPLLATIEFIREWVIEIERKDGTRVVLVDLDMDGVMALPEFRGFIDMTEAWYLERYGSSLKISSDAITGVVLIHHTPFQILVPQSVKLRPGDAGPGSWWVRWPERVLDQEDPLTWVSDGPNLARLSDEQRSDVRQGICAVANRLRFVHSRILATPAEGALHSILPITLDHLEGAARLILDGDRHSGIRRSFWDLQMACECAFKSVLEQKTGQFKETHDLFHLYDLVQAQGALPFRRDILKRLPRWEEVADLRYALGKRDNLFNAFYCYETALEVVTGTLGVLSWKYTFWQGEFCLAPLPWKRKPAPEASSLVDDEPNQKSES